MSLLLLLSCGNDLEEQNKQLSQRLDSLQAEVQQLRQQNASLREATGQALQVGYEVQIGAFREFDVAAYQDQLQRFTKLQRDGMSKYVLGRFARKEDAEAFLRDIRRMGITDAWIAGIADGERSTVADADEAHDDYYGDSWLPMDDDSE